MYKRYKNYITSSDDYPTNTKDITQPVEKPEEEKEKEKEKNFQKNKKEEKEKVKIRKITYCELCEKRLESKQDFSLHMSSKNHKHKAREFLRKELKECGSIKKVLIKEKLIAPYRRWKINNIRYLLYGFALYRYINK